jgi:hypothetical protein
MKFSRASTETAPDGPGIAAGRGRARIRRLNSPGISGDGSTIRVGVGETTLCYHRPDVSASNRSCQPYDLVNTDEHRQQESASHSKGVRCSPRALQRGWRAAGSGGPLDIPAVGYFVGTRIDPWGFRYILDVFYTGSFLCVSLSSYFLINIFFFFRHLVWGLWADSHEACI